MCQIHPALVGYYTVAGAAEDIRREKAKSLRSHEARKCESCEFFHAFPKRRTA